MRWRRRTGRVTERLGERVHALAIGPGRNAALPDGRRLLLRVPGFNAGPAQVPGHNRGARVRLDGVYDCIRPSESRIVDSEPRGTRRMRRRRVS
jgi:hypothetical protein